VEILRKELNSLSDELDDAVKAFLSLALIGVGREKEAAAKTGRLASDSFHVPAFKSQINGTRTTWSRSMPDIFGNGKQLIRQQLDSNIFQVNK